MKRILIKISIAVLLIALLIVPGSASGAPNVPKTYIQPNLFAQSVETSSQIRLPSGDYGSTGTWAVYPVAPTTKWDKVDDIESDTDLSYLTQGTTAGYALFNFTAFDVPINATVTKLEITYTARDVTAGVNNSRAALRIGGTNYLTTSMGIDLGTNYLDITYAFVTNPKTTLAWTVADINGKGSNPLQQFGINSSDANPAFRITMVKARVSYTEIVDTLTPPVYAAMDDDVITLAELTNEATSDAREGTYTFAMWDKEITVAGINHIDDNLLADFINNKPQELTDQYTQLFDLYMKAPVSGQVAKINTELIKLETQKAKLTTALNVAKGTGDKDLIQLAANQVAAVDGKISEMSQPLQYAGQITELESSIARAKNKFKLALKEQEFRSESLVTRTYVHSIYYMDFTPSTHSHLTGTVTFTNGSATVSAVGGNFDPEITVGDYIRQSDGTQWYKVTARAAASDNACTITPVFQQATHADDAGASFVCVSATNTGTTTALAFPHLNRYTTDTTRTAGDILKVRANQTHVIAGVSIVFDEDGTVTAYDEIRGCSVADDPFGDASAVQPIFDFDNTGFSFVLSTDDYWNLFNVAITNNNMNTAGLIDVTNSKALIINTCTIYNANHAGGVGIAGTSTASIQFIFVMNCNIYGNKNVGARGYNSGSFKITNTVFNGGVNTQDYGVTWSSSGYNGYLEISDCTFGVTTTHDVSSVMVGAGNNYLRNTLSSDSTFITLGANLTNSVVTSEDNGQVMGAQLGTYCLGTVEKSSTILRTGGGTSSALMLPSSVVTIKYPLNIGYGSLNPDFAIWCPASPTTVTVYIRANSQWASYPTIATPDDNLIAYPSFEATTGWTLVGAGAAFTSDAAQFKYGSKSGKLVRSGTDCYIYYPLTNYAFWDGSNVTYTCWAYATAANRVRIAINDGTTTTYSSYHTGGSTWEQLTVTAAIAAGVSDVQFRNYVDTGDTTAYFDGAYVVAPLHSQLFIQADYWAGVTAIRSQSTKSTQHIWDNNEPARSNDGTQTTLTADAGTNATTIVDAGLASAVSDNYNGWYVWNTTRSLGAEITDYDGVTKTITCANIAAQASGDTYYLMNWVAFSTTFTPGTAGFSYIKVNLGLYVATKGIYVDIKPVISH